MGIDIVYLVFLAIGVWQGFRKGIIETIFGVVALLLGVLVSVKLSYTVSIYLKETFHFQTKLLPIISMLLLLLITIFAIRSLSKLIEKIAQEIYLGFLNKLLGAILWCLVLSVIFSVLIWVLNQISLLPNEVKNSSKTYSFLVNLAPATFDFFGSMIPYFKNVFESLKSYLSDPSTQ